ncbi:sulfatase family protein [Runella sp.]|uniref:sulfatase family protein n=1 Tax=Runella sp. TaxID=1960881 RepID=UPI003D1114EB
MMKNLNRFFAAFLLTGVVGIVCVAFRTNPLKTKPNIIFLLTDDHRWNALGAMGNKLIKTPNLDNLANKGTLFKNACVTTAICCVSRASLLSGQYMSRHRIEDFNTGFSPNAWQNTYPMLLKKAGYQTGFIGKYGVGVPKEQPAKAFDFWAGSDKPQPDYEMKDAQGNFIHHTDKVNGDIEEFLQTCSKETPFCLSVSFKAPHIQDGDPRQFIVQQRYKTMYAQDSVPEPEKANPNYWNSFPDFFRTDRNIARERWYLQFANTKMYQESVRQYYRLISGVDEVVGNMLKSLQDKGLADNTVIIFMGDNGYYLGEYGLSGKWFGHAESIRVPLIIYDPRNSRLQRKTSEQFALNIDIAPTILSLAGVKVPDQMQGINLEEMVTGKNKRLNREEFFYEHTFLGSPQLPKVEGIVRKDFKYMKYIEHNYEELFDLKKVPQETQNAAANPAYREKLDTLRQKYREWKEKVR